MDLPVIDRSSATRALYARTTLVSGTYPEGVVHPTTVEEVQAIVLHARQEKLSLHPVSRGRNWGYGDATAPRHGMLIVDLSRMNRILEVNDELGYAVIEPGVTQGQLFDYIRARGLRVWTDGNGAGPDVSLVGNILERGFGHSPLGERASQCCGLEVVLGTGELLRTGFGHYPHAPAAHTYKHGLGPSLDGLFFQSGYGIVTRMTLWLLPAPESFDGFFLSSAGDELELLVERLGHLRRQGVVRSCMHVMNDVRQLMSRIDYPWTETGGRRPVPPALRRSWCEQHGIGLWNASGAVYGPASLVAGAMAAVREKLAPFELTELAAGAAGERAKSLDALKGLLQGIPSDGWLRTAGWRSPTLTPTSTDPLENGAGLIWIVPTLPATPRDARAVERLLAEVLQPHGFDVPITFTFINERSLTCTANINFNRQDADDTAAAATAYEEVMRKLVERGYPPYRAGIGSYGLLRDRSSFWSIAARLKSVLDPDGIMSNGHYLEEVT